MINIKTSIDSFKKSYGVIYCYCCCIAVVYCCCSWLCFTFYFFLPSFTPLFHNLVSELNFIFFFKKDQRWTIFFFTFSSIIIYCINFYEFVHDTDWTLIPSRRKRRRISSSVCYSLPDFCAWLQTNVEHVFVINSGISQSYYEFLLSLKMDDFFFS